MARTQLTGFQVLDGGVQRDDLNTTIAGQAVIRKLLAGNGMRLQASTGVDAGTGDVTVAVPLPAIVTPVSGTYTCNCAISNVFDLTLGATNNIVFSNGFDGEKILLRVRQDATGSRLITWPANVRFSASIPSVTLSTAINKMDQIALIYNAADAKYDFMSFNLGF